MALVCLFYCKTFLPGYDFPPVVAPPKTKKRRKTTTKARRFGSRCTHTIVMNLHCVITMLQHRAANVPGGVWILSFRPSFARAYRCVFCVQESRVEGALGWGPTFSEPIVNSRIDWIPDESQIHLELYFRHVTMLSILIFVVE